MINPIDRFVFPSSAAQNSAEIEETGHTLLIGGCLKMKLVSVEVSYWFVHLELDIVPLAEQLVRPRRGELFGSMS